MKKFFKILGIGLGAVLLLIIAGALFIRFKPAPTYDDVPAPDLQVAITPERVALGREISAGLCATCHAGNSGKLDGQILFHDNHPFGTMYASNITQHETAGIGTYTDGELYRLLRTGIKHDGTHADPAMYRSAVISDEDIYAIIAYLRSDDPRVAAAPTTHPERSPTLLARMLTQVAFKPLPYPDAPPETSPNPREDLGAYGAYLVQGRYECFNCHSADFSTNNLLEPELSENYLHGGTAFHTRDTVIVAPGITSAERLGDWSLAEFDRVLRYGKLPDGGTLRFPMMPYTQLDSIDVAAIYTYLQSH